MHVDSDKILNLKKGSLINIFDLIQAEKNNRIGGITQNIKTTYRSIAEIIQKHILLNITT